MTYSQRNSQQPGWYQRQKSMRVQYSSRNHPCPICQRTRDSDCRWTENWIACHTGGAANDLRPGQTINVLGETWYLSRTNGGHSGRSHIYRPHREGKTRFEKQRRKDTESHILEITCRSYYALLTPYIHATMRLPAWEECNPNKLALVSEVHTKTKELINCLQQASRTNREIARLTPIAQRWLKSLGYQLEDLKRFQAEQLH